MHFYTGLVSFVFFTDRITIGGKKTDKINQIILWTNKIKMQQNRICLLDCGELCWFIYEWTARSEQVGTLPVFGLLSVQSIMVAPETDRIYRKQGVVMFKRYYFILLCDINVNAKFWKYCSSDNTIILKNNVKYCWQLFTTFYLEIPTTPPNTKDS